MWAKATFYAFYAFYAHKIWVKVAYLLFMLFLCVKTFHKKKSMETPPIPSYTILLKSFSMIQSVGIKNWFPQSIKIGFKG